MSALAPASLGRAAQPQSADATRLLYERHSGRIFGYCLSLLGSREEAEDAVQTTFLNAQRGLGRGVVPEFELAWLFKIARNVCNNRRVSAWRRRRVESLRDLDTLQDALAGPERGGDVSVGELTRALAGIPERQRRALLLREWQGLSYGEIAAELGVTVAAVETLLFRARRSLADQLEQAGTSTRRRGVAASIVELFRWLLTGGAAPLKVAAATATVGAAVTLAVAPAVRHDPVPAPVSPQRSVPAVPRTHRSPVSVVRERVSPRPSRAAATEASSPPASSLPPSSSPAREAGPTRSSIPSGTADDLSGGSGGTATPPAVTVPSVPLATVTTPEVSVPELSLPEVQLPLEVQPLPEPPKLALP